MFARPVCRQMVVVKSLAIVVISDPRELIAQEYGYVVFDHRLCDLVKRYILVFASYVLKAEPNWQLRPTCDKNSKMYGA